ncbi:hypothetical protein [Pseudolysinimonas sp.]|jgi:hypothetical protein|uniref:hypothetical protein n=1 Tax=Pseudolysinimonas sp. TaxID=2680009 RepID=UPI00378446C8
MGTSVIDVHASPTWGHGSQTLAGVLEREHAVQPWEEPEEARPLRVHLPWGTSVYAPSTSVVRWRGDAVLILALGVVRIVTESGEIVLDDSERDALKAHWVDL